MRIIALFLALFITSMPFARVAAEEMDLGACSYDDAPVIPDGSLATEGEMADAASSVRQWVGEVQQALKCHEELETSMGTDMTPDQKRSITLSYNAGVDVLNEVAGSYNEQVKIYKSR